MRRWFLRDHLQSIIISLIALQLSFRNPTARSGVGFAVSPLLLIKHGLRANNRSFSLFNLNIVEPNPRRIGLDLLSKISRAPLSIFDISRQEAISILVGPMIRILGSIMDERCCL